MGSTGRELVSSQRHSLLSLPNLDPDDDDDGNDDPDDDDDDDAWVNEDGEVEDNSDEVEKSDVGECPDIQQQDEGWIQRERGGSPPYCRVGQDSLSRSVLLHNSHLQAVMFLQSILILCYSQKANFTKISSGSHCLWKVLQESGA